MSLTDILQLIDFMATVATLLVQLVAMMRRPP